MSLIPDWRAAWRLWSVRIAAIGAMLYAWLLADPAGLQAAWLALPPEVRDLLPSDLVRWVTAALFVLVALARVAKQAPVPATSEPLRLGLLNATPAWLTAVGAKNLRKIERLVVHCSATREGQKFTAADIRAWHKAKGWSDIGYHFVVNLDGTIEVGRPIGIAGAHVEGYNSTSVGICYVGGVAGDGKTPKDTRTLAQKAALLALLSALRKRYSSAAILGHRDFPKVAKACPSFDARGEYNEL